MSEKNIVVYATEDQGAGHVQEIGRFESLEDIEIRIGIFKEDVVITFSNEEGML